MTGVTHRHEISVVGDHRGRVAEQVHGHWIDLPCCEHPAAELADQWPQCVGHGRDRQASVLESTTHLGHVVGHPTRHRPPPHSPQSKGS
jgi:hypothetical protein